MAAVHALRGESVPAFGGSLEDSEVCTVFGVERFNPVMSVQDGRLAPDFRLVVVSPGGRPSVARLKLAS
jgi:hypothetical protein